MSHTATRQGVSEVGECERVRCAYAPFDKVDSLVAPLTYQPPDGPTPECVVVVNLRPTHLLAAAITQAFRSQHQPVVFVARQLVCVMGCNVAVVEPCT